MFGQVTMIGVDLIDFAKFGETLAVSLAPLLEAIPETWESTDPTELVGRIREAGEQFVRAFEADPVVTSKFVRGVRATLDAVQKLELNKLKMASLYVDYEE